jgi:hypothetical protein
LVPLLAPGLHFGTTSCNSNIPGTKTCTPKTFLVLANSELPVGATCIQNCDTRTVQLRPQGKKNCNEALGHAGKKEKSAPVRALKESSGCFGEGGM